MQEISTNEQKISYNRYNSYRFLGLNQFYQPLPNINQDRQMIATSTVNISQFKAAHCQTGWPRNLLRSYKQTQKEYNRLNHICYLNSCQDLICSMLINCNIYIYIQYYIIYVYICVCVCYIKVQSWWWACQTSTTPGAAVALDCRELIEAKYERRSRATRVDCVSDSASVSIFSVESLEAGRIFFNKITFLWIFYDFNWISIRLWIKLETSFQKNHKKIGFCLDFFWIVFRFFFWLFWIFLVFFGFFG